MVTKAGPQPVVVKNLQTFHLSGLTILYFVFPPSSNNDDLCRRSPMWCSCKHDLISALCLPLSNPPKRMRSLFHLTDNAAERTSLFLLP